MKLLTIIVLLLTLACSSQNKKDFDALLLQAKYDDIKNRYELLWTENNKCLEKRRQ